MTNGYKIKDVADRSGFTAATLRYYEQIGLLPESGRTPAGYRLYDDRTLDRLAFIARAKQLGCSLGEIADLTIAWDGGRCGPVQDQLRTLVAEKLLTAQQQIVALMTLAAELQQAAATLELHRPDGPCDEQCGCATDPTLDAPPAPQGVELTRKPIESDDSTAIACTLATQSMPARVDDWQQLLTHVTHREAIDGGIRVTFEPTAPMSELIRLAVAEQDCCRFFSFAITIDTRGVALEARSPIEALPIVHTVFGVAR